MFNGSTFSRTSGIEENFIIILVVTVLEKGGKLSVVLVPKYLPPCECDYVRREVPFLFLFFFVHFFYFHSFLL